MLEEIRVHGRGGQGVVTAAELIAIAAFYQQEYSQAFPNFGVERSGAPIQSYARISDEEIITHEQIYKPSVLIIADATLIGSVDVFSGIDKNTIIIINGAKDKYANLKLKTKKIYFTSATEIALEIFGKNIVNTIILGAFAKYTGLISLESLSLAIKEKFEDKGEEIIKKNIQAIERIYEK